MLNSDKTAGVEWFGVVSWWGELDFGAIRRGGPGMHASMLGTLGMFVKVSFEGFFDVAGHGEVDGTGGLVSFEREATIH